MPNLFNLLKAIAATACIVVAAGCANAPQTQAAPSGSLLSSAGFKTMDARTTLQQQHLRTLAQGSITEVQRTGKHYYVYPDVASNRLYVGTPKEYQAYLALRTRNGLPNPPPSNQTTADMRDYLKQDAAMIKADAQDATIPSWAIWPDFGGLGWVP